MHFSNGRFSNKETGVSGPYVVWSLLGAPGEKKRENQMYLQSRLSGEKKVAHFSSPEIFNPSVPKDEVVWLVVYVLQR